MIPIISIVGKSESGKTTLLEGLIAQIKQRGYRVAVIKHSGEDFEPDTVNKDSWRMRQAGSDVSAISSPHRLALFKNLEHDIEPQELSRFIGSDYDLILTEGFKQSGHPKIEVHRKEQGNELLSDTGQLLAVVTDGILDIDVPQFSKDEVQKITDVIEERIMAQRGENDFELLVNDAPVLLSQPTKSLMFRTLLAMVSALKVVQTIKNLHISLRRKT